jgi:tRNA(Ile)-lysidine synthase
LPDFETVNPGFFATVRNTLSRLEGTRSFLDTWLEDQKKNYYEIRGRDIFLKKNFFKNYHEAVILHEVIAPFGFNYDQTLSVFDCLNARSGTVFYSRDYILNIDRSYLIISRKQETTAYYEIQKGAKSMLTPGFKLELESMDADQEKIDPDPSIGYFDLDKLDFPLALRTWRNGDWFIPMGMKGKKKLSDFMIDKKIPLNLKKRTFVLLSGGSVVWVVGLRIDDRFKRQGQTKKLLKITYRPLDDQSI